MDDLEYLKLKIETERLNLRELVESKLLIDTSVLDRPILSTYGYIIEDHVNSIINSYSQVRIFDDSHPIFEFEDITTNGTKFKRSEENNGFYLSYLLASRELKLYGSEEGEQFEIDSLFSFGGKNLDEQIAFCEVKSGIESVSALWSYKDRIKLLESFFRKPVRYLAAIRKDVLAYARRHSDVQLNLDNLGDNGHLVAYLNIDNHTVHMFKNLIKRFRKTASLHSD